VIVGVPAFDPQATGFSAKNALLLAQLSTAAYRTEAEAKIVVEQLGFTNFHWINLTEDLTEGFQNVYAIGAGCADFAVVAFRGTQSTRDWMTDLYATPVSFDWIFDQGPKVGNIHAGFGHAVRDAWGKITTAVEAMIPRPAATADLKGLSTIRQPSLWLTGHSLGAALAVLTGAAFSIWDRARIRPVNGIYTFGQPRVGLYQFCGNYDHLLSQKTFRFVNKEDLVPCVPFRGWDYADLGQMIHFNSSGVPVRESHEWRNFLSRTFESFRDFFGIVTNIQTDVGDHAMSGYEQLVQTQSAALQALFP
jgi:triacylglycerol lipase